MGKADAVCVVSRSCCLADALATSIGNLVSMESDIPKELNMGNKFREFKELLLLWAKK
jgi:uncharacterized protein